MDMIFVHWELLTLFLSLVFFFAVDSEMYTVRRVFWGFFVLARA